MIRNIALASLLALGATTGAALAQDAGPVMTGGGDNLQIVYAPASRNVVGGSDATVTGGGDNEQVVAARSSLIRQSPARFAVLSGGGDNQQISYVPVDTGDAMLARTLSHVPNG